MGQLCCVLKMNQEVKSIQLVTRDSRNGSYIIPNVDNKLQDLIRKVYQKDHRSISTINLKDKRIGEEGGRYLAVALPYYSHIHYLYLSNCCLTPNVCQALSFPFKDLTELLELNLSDNDILAEGAMQISEGLVYMRQLLLLNLENTRLGPIGINMLTEALLFTKTLQVLNLAKNDIGPAGARCLSGILTEVVSLRNLDISCNNIGEQGAEALSTGILQLEELQSLGIGNNNIRTAGLLGIIENLAVTIVELGLEMNNIDDYGLIKLIEKAHYFVNLKVLILDLNLITDKGAKEFSSLKTLDLAVLSLVGCEVGQYRKELTLANLGTEILF